MRACQRKLSVRLFERARFRPMASMRKTPSHSIPVGAPSRRRLRPVDPRVCATLRDLAANYARHGVRIFLFGSAAHTWPLAAVGADFDLGYEIESSRSDQEALRRSLERDVRALPSIRPVDLVDFSEVAASFRAEAEKCVIELADEPAKTAAE